MNKFTATYSANDGYVIGDRPIKVTIDLQEIDATMDDEDIIEFFNDYIQEDFEQKVTCEIKKGDQEKFLEVAKKYRNKLKDDYET